MTATHRGQKRRITLTAQSRHPPAVAAAAEVWGRRYFRHYRMLRPDDKATVENMWHAGMLHGVMVGCGITWDEILNLANMEVANIVADVSRDNRLSYPRRVQEHANRLCRAEEASKIVKLADVFCNLKEVITALHTDEDRIKKLLLGWPEEMLAYLAALDKLAHPKFRIEWEWCQKTALYIGEIVKKWDCRQEILREIDDCPGITK